MKMFIESNFCIRSEVTLVWYGVKWLRVWNEVAFVGGEMTGGEMTGGEMTGGEMTGGEMTGGEMTGYPMSHMNPVPEEAMSVGGGGDRG